VREIRNLNFQPKAKEMGNGHPDLRRGDLRTKMIRALLFWSVLPFVIPQALWLRRVAPRFSAAAGALRGHAGQGRTYNLLAVGDSIIAGVGAVRLNDALAGRTARELSELLNGAVSWQAVGRIGMDSGALLGTLVARLPEQEADFIVVSVGVNDVTSLSRVSTWRRHLEGIIAVLRRHWPDAVIAFGGVPPLNRFPLLPQPLRAVLGLRAGILDEAARQVVAHHPRVIHVPIPITPHPDTFSADGYHPSEAGYATYGRIMAKGIAGAYHRER
jgi:lysophospholipase L1-like esterase